MSGFAAAWAAYGLARASAAAWTWIALAAPAFGVHTLVVLRTRAPSSTRRCATTWSRNAAVAAASSPGVRLAQCQPAGAMAMVGLHFLPLASGFRQPPPHVPALAQQGERKTNAARACDQQRRNAPKPIDYLSTLVPCVAGLVHARPPTSTLVHSHELGVVVCPPGWCMLARGDGRSASRLVDGDQRAGLPLDSPSWTLRHCCVGIRSNRQGGWRRRHGSRYRCRNRRRIRRRPLPSGPLRDGSRLRIS
jgi:hypothetical protein